jgi:RimJ/RimL family protein N-acetyltransferase
VGRIEPREVVLKGGERIVIRTAEAADVPALLEHLRHQVGAGEFSVTQADEFNGDPERMRQRVEDAAAKPTFLFLIAEHGGELAGELTFHTIPKRVMQHHGHFGISVVPRWRGRGVGRALITELLDWGAAHETIEKVCLGVFATNERAIGLYRALGFVEEGRRRKEFKFGPGRYVDDIQMFQWVKPVEGETAIWRAKNDGPRGDRAGGDLTL